jgi:outer membrane protein OmpA-like peptidoglycan-associated protein
MTHKLLLTLLPLYILSGCSQQQKIVITLKPKSLVVLADNGKQHNAIMVSNNKGTQRLDRVREFVEIEDENKSIPEVKVMSKEKFKKNFGNLVNALPEKALVYKLYFKENHMTLTPASKKLIPTIVDKIIETPSMVDIIGHTDTIGSDEQNFELSFQEASNVKAMLQEAILKILKTKQQIILMTKGYGEEDLLIHTPDNYKENRNRYVEIIIK